MRAGFLGVSDEPWAAGPGVPGLTSERLVAEQYLPGMEVRLDADANSRSFAELLRDRHWLHLACHGTTGTGSARAGIVLSDRVVRAEEILRYRDVATAYAFLPICGVARADPEVADEALHAAGALYRAGVPNVVGTLWEVYDHRDPRMSKVHRMVREFYAALAAQPSSVPPDMPLAYRDAVAKLIKVAPADLPHWCAFVCMAA
jgi:CHAT domain-containing protein